MKNDYKEIEQSTLGLTDADMQELGVAVDSINREVKAKEREEIRKKQEGILRDDQYFIFSLVILVIGIVVSILAYIIHPSFSIDIENSVQYGKMFLQIILLTILKFVWIPVLFEGFVILCRKYIGKFYKTWTRITMMFNISAFIGLGIIWFNGGF